jgi:hypothetical protein
MVVTITALVLSLLIASAKAYYDAQSNELTEMSANISHRVCPRAKVIFKAPRSDAQRSLQAQVAGWAGRNESLI